ncbi:MAG TPA: peptidylprolyl isomerase [Thermoguttaceae bacterium]|nr:peptidylprolyl isomerase [Thermoguttaceae bacterium]
MRTSLSLILVFTFLAAFVSAQSTPPAAAPDAANPPAAATGQAISPDDQAQFDKLFAEREALIKSLQALNKEYAQADAEKKAAILQQANESFVRLMTLHQTLVGLSEKIYTASPTPDARAEKLLTASCEGDLAGGNYEEALRLAKLLLEHGSKEKNLYVWGGFAAFCVGEPDLAETWLTKAAEENLALRSGQGDPLDPTALDFLKNPAEHKDAWKKELAIRAREAQADDLPRVLLKTNKGDIEVELFENEAPNTVANFVSLVEKGFYNGLTFHRVLPGFMAQGGCPKGDGSGGPGHSIACECYRPDYRQHFRGTLSMAHAGRDTGGSQFFLTFIPTSHLDGRHTAFGRVVKGMDVLAKIRRRDPGDPSAESIKPDQIVEAKVLRKRPHEYAPEVTRE